MAKSEIRYDEHFEKTMSAMTSRGLLLACCDGSGRPNAMTIGWGLIGSVWGKPMWVVLVRPSRYTYKLIEQTGDFTVNVPAKDLAKACEYCGTVSGADRDKFSDMNLTAAKARRVTSPIIEQCVIHYECRVVHKNDVQPGTLVQEIVTGAYPSDDFHRVYWGEIVASYADLDRLAEI